MLVLGQQESRGSAARKATGAWLRYKKRPVLARCETRLANEHSSKIKSDYAMRLYPIRRDLRLSWPVPGDHLGWDL